MDDKKVIMKATIEVTKPKNHKDYFIGGFNFIIDGNEIPFDFDASSYNINKNDDMGNDIVSYQSGHGMIFNDFDIAGYYENEYKELGLSEQDITAEFLSKVEKIEELYFYLNGYIGEFIFKIKEISFFDETDKEYKVDQRVLDEYNETCSPIQMKGDIEEEIESEYE